jgi:hypothetical protein
VKANKHLINLKKSLTIKPSTKPNRILGGLIIKSVDHLQ